MKTFHKYLPAVLNSYAVVFFSQDRLFGYILLAVSFLHPFAGCAALLAVIVAVTIANVTGFNRELTGQGLHSFNAMLTALGLATMYQHSTYFWFILGLATVSTVILSIILSGWLGKYGLPFLSLPFMLTFWIVSLADHHLTKNASHDTAEFWNATSDYINVHIPGLMSAANTVVQNAGSNIMMVFFRSLSAIFFQDNIFTGILIGIGFLLYSRIGFSLLVIGFCAAYGFELLSGESASSINYYNFGANYMMTAVALGAFFIIPSKLSYLWAVFGVFFCGVLIKGLSRALLMWELPVLSMPFTIVVIVMMYFFMQRVSAKHLNLTAVQHYSPEVNLYLFQNNRTRFNSLQYLPLSLPFMGEWTVSQGYEGNITHKGEWAKALDFVITDQDGRTYNGDGTQVKDYYCYNKPVLACADGFIQDVIDEVEDNAIGEADTLNNWGNSIVIRHTPSLFSKVSHLKKESLKVKIGDYVRRGDVIAACGSSGRSPEPHLHFQVQASPYIGSKTIAYPLGNYLLSDSGGKPAFESYKVPAEGDVVCNTPIETGLKKAFAFQPGYRMYVINAAKQSTEEWEVFTDAYNQPYIYCAQKQATAYFTSNGMEFYFSTYYGDKNSALYQFYQAAYHVVLSAGQSIVAADTFPLNLGKQKGLNWLQDLVAPFFRFVSLDYESRIDATDELNGMMSFRSVQQARYFKKTKEIMSASILIADARIQSFTIKRGNAITEFICTSNLI